MEIIRVLITSISSVIVLFLLAKLMGYRQTSQLSMFDYINGITIGSIAAELAVCAGEDYIRPLIAMIIYASAAVLLSLLENKSVQARRLINGTPLVLYNNGELYYKNLKKAKLNLCEFLTQCRVNGYFDLTHIQTALLESNGKLSILPNVQFQPATAADMHLTLEQDYLLANVIIDGKIMKQNLKYSGKNEIWLKKELEKKGYKDVKKILLATCDDNNNLTIYAKGTTNKSIQVLE